jgi:hypothetical protein
MERGDINQMSFGFIARHQEWDDDQDPPLRTIRAAELFDVSVVTYPAYEETEVGLRSLQNYRQEHETPQATVSAATRVRLRAKGDLASRLAGRSTR